MRWQFFKIVLMIMNDDYLTGEKIQYFAFEQYISLFNAYILQ